MNQRLSSAWRSAKAYERRKRTLTWRDALYSDSLASEIFLSLMLASLGIVALHVYHSAWPLYLVGLGGLRLYAIVKLHRTLRVSMAVVSLFTWLCMFFHSLKVAPQFSVIFLVFATQSFWVFMRMPLDGEGK